MAEKGPTDKQYKYDVAISFLGRDEDIARQLDNLLKARLNTFVYFDRQVELVGTDGENSLARVFASDSRLSVVLFRKEWGATPFTRIEETAIRSRGYDEGYDFLTVVMLDRESTPPKWLPKNRIWYDYETYGIDRLLPVIEARVQEAGGEFRVESPAQQAERLARERDFAKERESLLGSVEGVQRAISEVKKLFAALDEETSAICRTKSGIRPSFSHYQSYTVRIELGAWYTEIAWQNQVINSLIEAYLYVSTFKRDRYGHVPPTSLEKVTYRFDIMQDKRIGWSSVDKKNGFTSSQQLAQRCVKDLLDRLEASPPW